MRIQLSTILVICSFLVLETKRVNRFVSSFFIQINVPNA
ncbi:hypothetical protein RV12_GL000903 [Enterococcus quebecensis]|nr:hypothetical protein RV12_GL000903 [Enterococcus quebecensis]